MSDFKPNTLIPVQVPKKEFAKAWLTFMLPWHNLTSKEMSVATAYLEKYLQLCKLVPDDTNFRNKCLMSLDTQKEISKQCNLNNNQILIYKAKLRKANFFTQNNEINRFLIPNNLKTIEKGVYTLLVAFKLTDEEQVNEIQRDNTEGI